MNAGRFDCGTIKEKMLERRHVQSSRRKNNTFRITQMIDKHPTLRSRKPSANVGYTTPPLYNGIQTFENRLTRPYNGSLLLERECQGKLAHSGELVSNLPQPVQHCIQSFQSFE